MHTCTNTHAHTHTHTQGDHTEVSRGICGSTASKKVIVAAPEVEKQQKRAPAKRTKACKAFRANRAKANRARNVSKNLRVS